MEIGSIPARPGYFVTGDLNHNGINEIILLNKENNKRDTVIRGFEPAADNFESIYEIKLRNTSVSSIKNYKSRCIRITGNRSVGE